MPVKAEAELPSTSLANPGAPPHARVRRGGWWLLFLPAAVLLLVCFVYPLAILFVQSFRDPSPGLENYRQLAHSAVFRAVLTRTLTTSATVCLVCLLLGYPYAYMMSAVSRRWRSAMLIVVLLPFWTSLMVRNFSWLVLLQDNGIVNDGLAAIGVGRIPLIRNTTGVTIGMAHVMLPIAVLPMYAVMQTIDRRLLQAAEGCGARPAAAAVALHRGDPARSLGIGRSDGVHAAGGDARRLGARPGRQAAGGAGGLADDGAGAAEPGQARGRRGRGTGV